MTITIIGASGFLGKNLTAFLLERTTCKLRLFCRSADTLPHKDDPRVTTIAGDIFDEAALREALNGADCAVYLIHMMGSKRHDFAEAEAEAAQHFSVAAIASKLPRVVYMSGLGDESSKLSKHLASRHATGDIFREHLPQVLELRASMIMGPGSVAFDIIRAIATKLPILAVPRWAVTKTQPITLHDALQYLLACIELQGASHHQIIEIGGPEQLTYPQIVSRYARHLGRNPRVFIVPFAPRWAAVLWLKQFLPNKDSDIGAPMIASLHNEMIVRGTVAHDLFPAIVPQTIDTAFPH